MCFANKTFSEIFGDEKMWKKHINKFQTMINKGSFGYSELNNNILDDITKSRIALYKKGGMANVVKKNIKKFLSLKLQSMLQWAF